VKKAFAVFAALMVALAGLHLFAWRNYQDFIHTPLAIPNEGFVFDLEPGSNGKTIVERLAENGLTDAGWQWKLLMRLEPTVYRAGEYRLEPGTSPRGLLKILSRGKVLQYRFTLVEGWTFRQLVTALGDDAVLEKELNLHEPYGWDPGTLFEGMEHAEGWFLPETYQFTRGDSDRDILERAHSAMRQALEQAWAGRDTGLPLKSPYELLVLASIIEKETALEEEREQIAGVFVRRLKKGMRLQTDPTVIYGIGESFDGDIRRRDLRTDTPYNTYTRHGLPPTPIAMPGRDSLLAAAHPAEGEALFFVADGQGGHTFSRTLEEHQAAVNKMLGRN
jgi:UPF0755 protein